MNRFHDRLTAGECLAGLWLSSDSVVALEMAGQVGFDWVVLDLEHGHFEASLVLSAIRTADAAQLALVVRVPDHAPAPIGRYLDWGAAGIMVPNVQTAAQAQAIAAAMHFAPQGRRGMSRAVRSLDYGAGGAPSSPVAIVQIESQQAVEQVDAIAAVNGVDALFLGHTDLSQDLGCLGNLDDPRLRSAEQRLLTACAAHRKRAGMAAAPAAAQEVAERGFRLLTVGSDVSLLRNALRKTLETSRLKS